MEGLRGKVAGLEEDRAVLEEAFANMESMLADKETEQSRKLEELAEAGDRQVREAERRGRESAPGPASDAVRVLKEVHRGEIVRLEAGLNAARVQMRGEVDRVVSGKDKEAKQAREAAAISLAQARDASNQVVRLKTEISGLQKDVRMLRKAKDMANEERNKAVGAREDALAEIARLEERARKAIVAKTEEMEKEVRKVGLLGRVHV